MNYEIVESKNKAKYCVIWLHGLGADGNDFKGIVPQLNLPNDNVRFLFPHADNMPVTINMGMTMRAWYDIKSLDSDSLNRIVDNQGIQNSINNINNLINEQIEKGISSENILLIGFSQGGVIATYTTITNTKKLAGAIALSTYLPAWNDFKSNVSDINKNSNYLVCHGTHDQVLPEILGKTLSDTLQSEGFKNQYKSYQFMQHSVCPQEIEDISKFIQQTFNL